MKAMSRRLFLPPLRGVPMRQSVATVATVAVVATAGVAAAGVTATVATVAAVGVAVAVANYGEAHLIPVQLVRAKTTRRRCGARLEHRMAGQARAKLG